MPTSKNVVKSNVNQITQFSLKFLHKSETIAAINAKFHLKFHRLNFRLLKFSLTIRIFAENFQIPTSRARPVKNGIAKNFSVKLRIVRLRVSSIISLPSVRCVECTQRVFHKSEEKNPDLKCEEKTAALKKKFSFPSIV